MKFGYRDRIILLVMCVIIIFGAGIFIFIKPKYQELQKDKKARDDLKSAWSVQLDKFNNINTRQDKIEEHFKKATDISLNFTDEMDSVALDNFLREQFGNTEQNVADGARLTGGYTVSDEMTAALSYYYYTPSIVTYPLYEAADMDGSLAKAAAEKRKESDVLSARSGQTVGAGTSSFTITINREDVMTMIDAVHDYAVKNKDAMLINSISISDYKFRGGLTQDNTQTAVQQPAEGEEGQAAPAQPSASDEEDKGGTADVTILYTVYYMQEPKKPDLGPKYDPAMWDNGGWETYTSAEQPAEQTAE